MDERHTSAGAPRSEGQDQTGPVAAHAHTAPDPVHAHAHAAPAPAAAAWPGRPGPTAAEAGEAAEAADKQRVALWSLLAACALVAMKLTVGVMTGSLSILAEAAHSTLDLVASALTMGAVRLAGQPADAEHRYGHGKAENLAAFVEALLLLGTVAWIVAEAVGRLRAAVDRIDVSVWAAGVMAISIAVDVVRSRALERAARRYGSQALAADALNFRTDILTSSVVLAGLLLLLVGRWTGWDAGGRLPRVDPLAALAVSGIVLTLAVRMAREAVDVLLDRAPGDEAAPLAAAVGGVSGVLATRRLRLRRSGNRIFADVVVAVPRGATFTEVHAITEAVEAAVSGAIPGAGGGAIPVDVVVHAEPETAPDEAPGDAIRLLAWQLGLRAHDVRLRTIDDRLDADLHVEVDPTLSLDDAHALTVAFEQSVRLADPRFGRINTHIEAPDLTVERHVDVTTRQIEIAARVRDIADAVAGGGSCHEVKVYRLPGPPGVPAARLAPNPDGRRTARHDAEALWRVDLLLHCSFPGALAIAAVHEQSAEIERRLHTEFPEVRSVLVHAEPAADAPTDAPTPAGPRGAAVIADPEDRRGWGERRRLPRELPRPSRPAPGVERKTEAATGAATGTGAGAGAGPGAGSVRDGQGDGSVDASGARPASGTRAASEQAEQTQLARAASASAGGPSAPIP